jgi:putrescine transport system permease protein
MTRHPWLASSLVLGFVFLYLPLILLVGASFNAAPLATVWGGFSLRWYRALAADDALMRATWLSLRIAAGAACLATILGAAAGIALSRWTRFPARTPFAALLLAPLVLPDLLMGLGLLLLFVASQVLIGIPGERGATTILIAHATLGMAYVAIVVRARLAGDDATLEHAAQDLGASPLSAFLRITLPLISPSLIAGWLLAFTLSLDDVVLASFVSGPGATTLPMEVFSALHRGPTPILNALATVLLAIVALALVAASAARRR